MPLNAIPPTTTVANFQTKREASHGKCFVDVAFWGGLVGSSDNNTVGLPLLSPYLFTSTQTDLVDLYDAGVKGFKCFTIDSGVPEFPAVSEKELWAALPELQVRSICQFARQSTESRNAMRDCSSTRS
jgi:allantoinase